MSFAPGPVETAAFMAAQAARTAPMRRHLYRKASLARRSRVLDVGCGTGGVTAEIAAATAGGVVGVDRDAGLLEYAASACGTAEFVQADCERLPFPDGAFDMVTCHFFLMWARDAGAAVREMVRVLEPGGVLLAAAEPDYG
ncbi:MAG: class I SAM-dependent methyltransferase, partial [Gemmatimonadetes bacterium]|nr:class I SAM-dependent methyltransferase [Gemmatimonadota bacterium]